MTQDRTKKPINRENHKGAHYLPVAPLRDKIPPDVEPFDVHKFRQDISAPKIRN